MLLQTMLVFVGFFVRMNGPPCASNIVGKTEEKIRGEMIQNKKRPQGRERGGLGGDEAGLIKSIWLISPHGLPFPFFWFSRPLHVTSFGGFTLLPFIFHFPLFYSLRDIGANGMGKGGGEMWGYRARVWRARKISDKNTSPR